MQLSARKRGAWDHVAIAATLRSGAIASVFCRGGTSRGDNLRWEINGSEGDLVLTSPIGNLQVVAPTLHGGRGNDTSVRPLAIPAGHDLAPSAPDGPAANVARLYAAFAKQLAEHKGETFAPDFAHAERLHGWLSAITLAAASGQVQRYDDQGASL